jgi:hypothetical protein
MLVWGAVDDESVTIMSELLEEKELDSFVDVMNVFELPGGFVDFTKVLEVLEVLENAGEDGALDGDVVEAATLEHLVVGWAVTQAHREFAAPKTLPAEAPHALITQFSAADWIAAD